MIGETEFSDFLYDRHQNAKGITAIPIGILDLRRAMKDLHGMKQSDVGDGNLVNAKFTELAGALDDLDQAIADSRQLTDEQKLDAAGDISAIRAQVAKKNSNSSAIRGAWEGLRALPVLGNAAEAIAKVGKLLASLLS